MSNNTNPLAPLLAKHLKVGAVIYKFCDFTTPPKNKYMTVASTEPRLLTLMINTKVNDYYHDNNLAQFHVPVHVADHSFLKHDSFANCIEAHTAFDYSAIREEVVDDYANIFKGWLTDKCLENVYHAVKGNNVIRTGHQKEIIASIEKHLPHLHSAF